MADVKDVEKADIEELEVKPTTRVSARSPDEERRLVRKIDLRIMPIACVLYLFACEGHSNTPHLNFILRSSSR